MKSEFSSEQRNNLYSRHKAIHMRVRHLAWTFAPMNRDVSHLHLQVQRNGVETTQFDLSARHSL